MKRTVAIGIQDFETLRMENRFYIDKTELIREWWNRGDAVTLLTRPRRFGKTLNMSMLNCFFSRKYQNRSDLFEGLKVWEDEEIRKEQGCWPVIFLSFANIKFDSITETIASMNQLIANEYNRYARMIQEPGFTDADRAYFNMVNRDMPVSVAADSLNRLSEWIYRYYGKKVIILLDEYDTPMQEAYVHGFWKELVSYIRALFNGTFKTNPSLARGIMTGITRVSKESIFSDLNNLEVVTTSSNRYADCFGFTEEEVYDALEEQGFGKEANAEVKKWYDGFTFGGVTDIYNPWSVINYLDKRKPDTYWANTSGNALAGKLIREGDPGIKKQFESLLAGENIRVAIDEQILFDQLDDDRDAIWSLLLASGYLKAIRTPAPRGAGSTLRESTYYTLGLTNHEVEIMFENMVKGWFKAGDGLSPFVQAMLQGNVRDMNRYMNRIALQTFSSFDTGNHPGGAEPERFYHGFVLGLMVERTEDYHLRSNRESGFGRYDVVMEPKNDSCPAVIMEFKVLDEEDGEKTLEDTARNALKQIEEKKYEADLIARGIPEDRILRYGFAFRGKECKVLMSQLVPVPK